MEYWSDGVSGENESASAVHHSTLSTSVRLLDRGGEQFLDSPMVFLSPGVQA